MTEEEKTRLSQIEAFARLHGLERLAPDDLARMAELAPQMAQLGSGIPRPPGKADAPAERHALSKVACRELHLEPTINSSISSEERNE